MKYVLFVFWAFSVQLHASTCVVTDDMQQDMNLKHEDKIAIETILDGDTYSVLIHLPEKINDAKLNGVLLFSGSAEAPLFVVPLATFEEEGETLSWYHMDAGYAARHFIAVSFGERCGLSVIKEVHYN